MLALPTRNDVVQCRDIPDISRSFIAAERHAYHTTLESLRDDSTAYVAASNLLPIGITATDVATAKIDLRRGGKSSNCSKFSCISGTEMTYLNCLEHASQVGPLIVT
ncbi:hypothetical protein J3458_020155 [Metarhizium acridum]|uniref:uncharacterized protein n=1 Tax=Metarhizium acridum TaxID=92637 RepID=UPI001C6D10AF|nr:hypothetical protein J3458_020155 [Metarhizium acridum]